MFSVRTPLAAFLVSSGVAIAQDNVLREGVGDRGAELQKMELEPFDPTLWGELTGWANGTALDASATEGRPVLVYTFASWNPGSTRLISTMQRLHDTLSADGLIVLGVHHATGFDNAPKALADRKAGFLYAHDGAGRLREKLLVDQDPDVYFIDRAGQLRFADVRNESIEEAAAILVKETREEAAGIRERLAEGARMAEEEFARTTGIRESVDMRSLPEVAFEPPAATAYTGADWPDPPEDENSNNDEDRPLPQLNVPSAGWLGRAPATKGRAVLYYSFTLDDPRAATWAQEMEVLQRKVGRDAVVVGVITLGGDQNDNRRVDPVEAGNRVERFKQTYRLEHAMLYDPENNIMRVVDDQGNRVEGTSMSLVVSSDNTVRWWGLTADPARRSALDRVIDADPGVRARRAAEEAYLKSKGG